jgi:hypothetical protein
MESILKWLERAAVDAIIERNDNGQKKNIDYR